MLDLDGLQVHGQFFNNISERWTCMDYNYKVSSNISERWTRMVRSVLVYSHKHGCNIRLVNVRLVNV